MPTWLSNHGPPSHMRQRTDGFGTPAARDSARVSASAGRVTMKLMTLRSLASSGLRSGEHTAW